MPHLFCCKNFVASELQVAGLSHFHTVDFNAPQPLQRIIARVPLFAALEPKDQEQIAEFSRRIDLGRGQILFREGEACESLHIVESGCIRILKVGADGRAQVVHHALPVNSFAEAAVFGMARYPAGAEAATRSVVIAISRDFLLRELRKRPDWGERIIGSLSMWLHRLVDRVEELTLGSSAARLAHYLVRQPASGLDTGSGVVVRLDISKREVAGRLNIAPETLSRVLHEWQMKGFIQVHANEIEIRNAEALEKIAAPS